MATPASIQTARNPRPPVGTEHEAFWRRYLVFLLLAFLPIFLFYVLLFRTLTGLPFNDDYKATLGFVLEFRQASGWHELVPVFMHRHNEYLLIFQNAIYAVQYKLFGQLHFKVLTVIGDFLVLPLFGTLWLIWSEYELPRHYAFMAFLPVSWVLFELQYASTLNCVMAPLQNVAVLIFTLAAFYYGARRGDSDFAWSLLYVVLSITASGGGLLVGPVLCLLFLQKKEWKRLAIMLLVSLVLGWLYLHFRYLQDPATVQTVKAPIYQSFSLPYAAAFLGSIAAGSRPAPAIAFAALMLGIFVYMALDGLYRRNAGLYFSTLFFFIQALSVSALRAPRGIVTALGSRYRINSVVLVILLYFFLAEKMRYFQLKRQWRVLGLAAMAVVLLGFNLASDRAGYRLLHLRRIMVQQGVARWEHHEVLPVQTSSQEPDYMEKNAREGMYNPLEPLLTESIQAGIYTLPAPGPNQ